MMKYSRQKELILNSLKERRDHPTADMLYFDLKAGTPDIGIATVYRNLSKLSEEGKILRLHFAGEADRFDGNTAPHSHLVCSVCKNIYDIFPMSAETEALNDIANRLSQEIGAEHLGTEFNIRGVCCSCKRASGSLGGEVL
ncbi:MAG: transcriptional repressor [Oscillospiraceae bacterium]|jgi:Fur family peroxide stress response transcriptional regulator|nr:transcriptional repressor [Oscillospiraceae bacterium]